MNYPVSNGKHCDLCEEVLTEPFEEEEFILQVQFSDENVHLADLTQENYVGNQVTPIYAYEKKKVFSEVSNREFLLGQSQQKLTRSSTSTMSCLQTLQLYVFILSSSNQSDRS